jgi:ribosomal protein L29
MLNPDGHKESSFMILAGSGLVGHDFNRIYDLRQSPYARITALRSPRRTKQDPKPDRTPHIRRTVSAILTVANETLSGQPPELSSGSAPTPS